MNESSEMKGGIDSFRDEILKHFNKLQSEHNDLQQKYKEAIHERNVANTHRDIAVKDVSLAIKERDRSIVEKVNATKDKIAMSQERDRAYVERIRAVGERDDALEEIARLNTIIEKLQSELAICQDDLAQMTEERNYYFDDSQKLHDGLKRLEVNTFDEWKGLEREIFQKLNGEIELSPQELLAHELDEKLKEATFYRMNLNARLIDTTREIKYEDDTNNVSILLYAATELEDRRDFWDKRIKEIELDIKQLNSSQSCEVDGSVDTDDTNDMCNDDNAHSFDSSVDSLDDNADNNIDIENNIESNIENSIESNSIEANKVI